MSGALLLVDIQQALSVDFPANPKYFLLVTVLSIASAARIVVLILFVF